MKGLDLRSFKKLKTDAKSTTLKHPDGHKIVIAHAPLSKKMREDLHALPFADGGEIPGGNGSPAIDPSKVGGDVTTSGDPIVNAISSYFGGSKPTQSKAKGGKIQDPTQRHLTAGDKEPNKIERQVVDKARGRMYEDGGYVDTVDSGDPIYQKLKKQPSTSGEEHSGTPNSKPTPENPNDTKYKQQVADFNAQMAPEGYADGGKIKRAMYADGTPDAPVSPQDSEAAILNDIANQQPQPQAPEVPMAQQAGNYVGSTIGQGFKDAAGAFKNVFSPVAQGVGQAAQGLVQGLSGQPSAPIPTMDQAAPPQQQQPMPTQGPANSSQGPGDAKQMPQPPVSGMQAGLDMQMQGLQNQYKAEKQAGQERAKVEEQAIAQQQQQAQSYDNRMSVLQQERQNILNDKIDPNHLWNSKSTTDKVGTILGLLVGGFNPRGNDSVKMLDDAISRDIDAQKTNKSNALNSLTQMFGDANTAAQYHRVILNDQVAHGIDLAMAHAATPQAMANLQQAKGKLMFDSGIRMAGIGAQVTLNNGTPNEAEVNKSINTLQMMDPEKAKVYRSMTIPGIGVGNQPIDNKTREAFTAGQTFMQQMDQLEAFRQAHGGGKALFGAAADEGNRLAELARNSFRIAQGEGVFKAGSQHFNERLIPNPTDIDLFGKNKNAYADMKNQAQMELQNSMKTNGIRPFANSPIRSQGSPSGYQPKSAKPVK